MTYSPIIWQGVLIPFAGILIGSSCAFFVGGILPDTIRKALTGFAAGIMLAASVWGLLMPAVEGLEGAEIVPVLAAFWLGALLLMVLHRIVPHLTHSMKRQEEGSGQSKSVILMLAVALHNIPEGMALGVVLVGFLSDASDVTMGAALALSIGIALHNIPVGAIISLPLRTYGMSSKRAFLAGALVGAVEPVSTLLTLALAGWVTVLMPYFLAFAAGAILYVVIEELIPSMGEGEHSHAGVLSFLAGFTIMVVFDLLLE